MIRPDWSRYQVVNGGLELLEAEFTRHVYGSHFHETYAIGMTLRDVQRFRCGRHHFDSVPGDVILIPPGETHDGESGTPDGYAYRMFYVAETLLRELIAGGTDRLRGGVLLHDAAAADELANAWHMMSEHPSSLKAEEHFVRGLNLLAHSNRRNHAGSASQMSPILERVRDYLQDRPSTRVSLSELAEIAGMSRFRLTRAFQLAYGLPLHAYNLQVRLHEAKRRLTKGEPVVKVAVDLGFSDQSHFHRRFRTAFGVTPGQWREAHVHARYERQSH